MRSLRQALASPHPVSWGTGDSVRPLSTSGTIQQAVLTVSRLIRKLWHPVKFGARFGLY